MSTKRFIYRAQRYILAKNSPNMPGFFLTVSQDSRKRGIAPVENARKYFSTICVTADKISALSFGFFGIKV
jgi:hypothetical protein